MRKIIKILASCIAFILVVSVISIALIIYFIDPNSLKPLIIDEVAKKTGYKLVIDGQLTWTLYPRLGIFIPHLTLTDRGQSTPFIELKSVKMMTPLAGILKARENLSGDLQISDLTFMKLNLHDAKVGIHWANNILTLEPLTAKLYGGVLQGNAIAKQLTANPYWSWDVNVNNVQIRSLLSDLSQKQSQSQLQLSGLAQIKVIAKTQGKSKDALLENLAGNIEFSMQQGMVEGVNLDFYVESADAIINKREITIPDNLKQTRFEHLTATGTITNGIVRSKDILLQSQTLTTQGQGTIDLVAQTIDVKLLTKPNQQIKTQYEIPVTITGQLSDPRVGADMREIENKVAKEVVDRLKNKVEDKISKFLGQ